jgi:hypothetical protein
MLDNPPTSLAPSCSRLTARQFRRTHLVSSSGWLDNRSHLTVHRFQRIPALSSRVLDGWRGLARHAQTGEPRKLGCRRLESHLCCMCNLLHGLQLYFVRPTLQLRTHRSRLPVPPHISGPGVSFGCQVVPTALWLCRQVAVPLGLEAYRAAMSHSCPLCLYPYYYRSA